MTNKDLKKRIIEISYKMGLSHIGSCLTAVDIIKEIYDKKKPDEKFVLSSGHAALALYCVLENNIYENDNPSAETMFEHHGVHPDRCGKCHIDCSSGSLGNGLPIAVGMALADRSKQVWCLISDGECAEGSIWEALHIMEDLSLNNLNVYVNDNGYGAYRETPESIYESLLYYDPVIEIKETNMGDWPLWLQGQKAHYAVIDTEEKYKEIMSLL